MAKPTRSRRGKPPGRSGGASELYAALDLGTNNCRLLIAEKSASGGLRIVDSYSQIVALGEGLAASGRLSDLAMDRAMDALKKCSDKVKKHKPVQARFIATQACRQASNGRVFVSEVRRRVGLNMETDLAEGRSEVRAAWLARSGRPVLGLCAGDRHRRRIDGAVAGSTRSRRPRVA